MVGALIGNWQSDRLQVSLVSLSPWGKDQNPFSPSISVLSEYALILCFSIVLISWKQETRVIGVPKLKKEND